MDNDVVKHFREEYIKMFWSVTGGRPGANDFLGWLETTDFFEAPASTKYHLSTSGGLVMHSITVAKEASGMCLGYNYDHLADSAALCGLVHDICKAGVYKPTTRRVRGEDGTWKTVPAYEYDDALPLGHGEKSLFLAERHGLRLTDEEAAAIRWHMGPYRDRDAMRELSEAFQRYPLAAILHSADMIATYIIEMNNGKKEWPWV